jgi:O-antigen/teichoic acid export membrane protein
LNGLEQQVPLNIANMIFATLRWIGVIPVLWWVAPTIEVYLYWQVAVATLQTLAMGLWLWRALPGSTGPARFRVSAMHQVLGFATGMFAIAALSFVLVQIDRIVLSRTLPLDQFGHYVLAATVAAALSRAFNPFFTALYPRYSGLVAAGLKGRLNELYLSSNRYLAVLVTATAAVLGVFSRDTLFLWTGDPALASNLAPVLSILAAGAALNGLMNLPYALQLAHGWTQLTLWVNGISLLVMVPLTFWLARRFGMTGAASGWLALNAFNFLLIVPIIHRRLLPSAATLWYLIVLPPLLVSVAIAFAIRLSMPAPLAGITGIATLMLIGIVVLSASFLASGMSQRYFKHDNLKVLGP